MKRTVIIMILGIMGLMINLSVNAQNKVRIVQQELELLNIFQTDSIKILSVYGNERYLCAKTMHDSIYYEVAFELTTDNQNYIAVHFCRQTNRFSFDILNSIKGCERGNHTIIGFDLGEKRKFKYYVNR